MAAALRGSFCSTCGEHFYPAGEACPRCGQPLQRCAFSGKGDVYSYTTVSRQPDALDDASGLVAIVHLSEGAYVTARLAGISAETVFIGLPVEAVSAGEPLTFRLRSSFGE